MAVSEHFDEPVSVHFATEDETASDENSSADVDYQSGHGVLSWSPGDEAVKTIRIPVFGDTDAELDERFQDNRSSAEGGIGEHDYFDCGPGMNSFGGDGAKQFCFLPARAR